MAHPIPAPDLTPFKKGDRVQHADSGIFGTVYQDQTDPLLVHLSWDKTPFVVECYKVDAVRVAPWHEISFDEARTLLEDAAKVDPVHRRNFRAAGLLTIDIDTTLTDFGGAVKADPAAVTPIHKIGDRVKLKYNRSCGTVKANAFPGDRTVPVEWDKAPGIKAIEELEDLVVLYAPRDNDPVNPNQEAIDAIEVQRQALIKEVNAVQARLRTLNTAKRLLERG